jgi:hypothetical protein
MKAKIFITFKKIVRIKVDKTLLEKEPKLIEATRKTLLILCQNIKKYFQDNKIKVGIECHLEND